jgi:hypothetical protein
LGKAVKDLGFPHATATPGVHETNSQIERRNETSLGGTRTLLEHAGFPACFWPLASAYFAHALNVELHDGDSAWNQRHGRGHFSGPKIHFGALVDFVPNVTKKKWAKRSKWNPKAILGVFVGYFLQPGHVWKGEYLMAALEDCAEIDLRTSARNSDAKLPVSRSGNRG